MKAGIFKRQDNGKHIYVRKDRSIGAIELTDVHPCDSEYKVSERVGGKYVNVPEPNGEYFATVAERVADAPKGVNDCVKALGDYVDSLKRSAEEANDDDFSLKVDPTTNPAEAARQIAVMMADQMGVEVDHESFDKAAAALETQAEIEQVPRKPRRVPVVVPTVRLVAQNDAAVAEQDPELAAYHGEADESDREAVNLLPDDVSPAQWLHEFVAERLKAKGLNVIDTELVEPAPYSTFATQVKMEREEALRGSSPMFDLVEKPTDISADGFREIRAMQEQVKADVIRKFAMPRELAEEYPNGKSGRAILKGMMSQAEGAHSGMLVVAPDDTSREWAKALVETYRQQFPELGKVVIECLTAEDLKARSSIRADGFLFLDNTEGTYDLNMVVSTPSDAKRFVEEHLQPKFEAGGVGGVGLRENEIAMPVGRLAFPLVCERQDEQLGVNLSAKGTFTAEVTLSPQMQRRFRQAVEAGRAMHEQMVNDFLTDRIEFQPGVSGEVLWHNDEERERLARERLARGEFRLCHAAAARKHKKKRDRYVWWHPVFGCYAWKKIEARA